MRWQPPGQDPALPNELISLAEETGLIVPISILLLRKACLQIKEWSNAGFKPLRVAINLSSRQFYETNLTETIETVLEKTGCHHSQLEFEITENMLMHDVEWSKGVLHHLKEKGCQISIDDFGAGYSSFNYLRQLPIDKLKIDKSFIDDIVTDARSSSIVKGIIMLSHSLNFKVIAEGVETLEQKELLCDYNCDEMQGYYYSRPVPPESITKLLQNESS